MDLSYQARAAIQEGYVADPTCTDFFGNNLLWEAFTAEDVHFFISHGVDPNHQNSKDRTPLHDAGSAEVVRALLHGGADVTIRDIDELTPLFPTVNTDSDMAVAILEAGGDITHLDSYGRNVLFYLSSQQEDLLWTYLKYGAEVNILSDGITPLHHHVSDLFSLCNSTDDEDLSFLNLLLDAGGNFMGNWPGPFRNQSTKSNLAEEIVAIFMDYPTITEYHKQLLDNLIQNESRFYPLGC